MLLQNAVKTHDTWRKRRKGGIKASPMAPNKGQEVREVEKTQLE
jgi:hypothetical protein